MVLAVWLQDVRSVWTRNQVVKSTCPDDKGCCTIGILQMDQGAHRVCGTSLTQGQVEVYSMYVVLRIKQRLCLKLVCPGSVRSGLRSNCLARGIDNVVSPPVHVSLDDHSVCRRILGIRQHNWHDVIKREGLLVHTLHRSS